MLFSRRSPMEPVWACRSAAPSSNRTTADCGPPPTLRVARVFTSFCPPRSRHETNHPAPDRQHRNGDTLTALLSLGCLTQGSATTQRATAKPSSALRFQGPPELL